MLNAYLYLGQYDKFLASLPEVEDSSFFVFYRGFGEYHQRDWTQAARDFDAPIGSNTPCIPKPVRL